jgi:hypothetical protein
MILLLSSLEYSMTRFGDPVERQDNLRLSFGLVSHIGNR